MLADFSRTTSAGPSVEASDWLDIVEAWLCRFEARPNFAGRAGGVPMFSAEPIPDVLSELALEISDITLIVLERGYNDRWNS